MLKLLSIVSKGRSGSTLIDQLLGQVPSVQAVGELDHIWDWGFVRGGPCGCGRPVASCEFWSEVFDLAFGGRRNVDPRRMVILGDRLFRWRHLPRLLLRGDHPRGSALNEYLSTMGDLVRGIAEVSGAEVLVDSSKLPTAGPMGLIPGTESYVVHLVRDPRAVAHSWTRQKSWDAAGEIRMPTWGPAHSALSWLAHNSAAEILRRQRGSSRSLILRYEDFVRRPRIVLDQVLRLALRSESVLPFIDERTAEVHPTHSAFGNPSRFTDGRIVVREDEAWKGRQSASSRWVTTGITYPLMRYYGYSAAVDSGTT